MIPQNMEKYLSFSLTVGQLKFIDSFQFTPKGLNVLAKTLGDANVSIPMTIWIALSDLTRLPSQDAFFSKLSGSHCSDSVYTHATRLWTAFGCKTMADYHDIYLQLDVLLLADVSEKFRTTCLEYYSLDPIHYYTTPGLAWDAALRMSHVDLQVITDMYHFVGNSIRGGISMISTRHAQANSPSFPDTYDSSLPNQNLTYLDANNLY